MQNLMTSNKPQTIILSGESGTGKTESTKYLIKFLCQSTDIDKKIIAAAPILEAFGNAKTSNNNNSSRCSKHIQVDFNLIKIEKSLLIFFK